MNKKNILQIVLLLALAGGVIYFLENWFKPEKIPILCDIHPPRIPRSGNPRPAADHPPFDIAFGLDQKYELTSLKVVVLNEWATNKETPPLWHLVSETNSPPVKAIIYGRWIQGMHAAVKGARPQPLQTNVIYRLIIETASRVGDCDFKLPALPQLVR